MGAGKQWLPLESNPEVMDTYLRGLGFPDTYVFHDIYGFDPDLLAMVPSPVRAVLMLFPITAASEAAKAEQEARIAKDGQQVSDKVWFTKQTVGNACGTIGLLHAAANLASEVPPAPGSWLAGFLARTAGMDASARAAALEEDDSLDAAHAAAASTGQSAAPADDEEVNLHFVAFVHVDGGLYELDGRKPAPVRHGDSGADSLLADAVAVVQREFVARADGNVNFNLVALAPPMDD